MKTFVLTLIAVVVVAGGTTMAFVWLDRDSAEGFGSRTQIHVSDRSAARTQ